MFVANNKILRTTTVPESLTGFCTGLLRQLHEEEGYEIAVCSSPLKELDEICESDGVTAFAVHMERHIAPFKDLKSLCGMVRVMRQFRPTMVHSMTPKAGLLSMMAGWLCRVPVRVHTFTGLVWPTATGLKRRVLMFTDWVTCACATHIIPEGKGVKSDLLNHHITRKPLRVLGHGNVKGIDLERFNPENPEVITEASKLRRDDVFTFVFVGRLVGDKGINELVRAFCRLQNAIKNIAPEERTDDVKPRMEDVNDVRDVWDWSTSSRPISADSRGTPHHTPAGRVGERLGVRLVLVGPEERELDPLKPETLAEIERNPGIEAVGPKRDVRPWYAMADAFVFPSYREGFPNCVIEAGAMGLPSIVTDINGSREIIEDGVNGIIIPSKDEDALFEAMKRILESKENTTLAPKERADDVKPRMKDDEVSRNVWVQMKRNARPMIASRFEQGYVRQCLKDFYKEILTPHQPSPEGMGE